MRSRWYTRGPCDLLLQLLKMCFLQPFHPITVLSNLRDCSYLDVPCDVSSQLYNACALDFFLCSDTMQALSSTTLASNLVTLERRVKHACMVHEGFSSPSPSSHHTSYSYPPCTMLPLATHYAAPLGHSDYGSADMHHSTSELQVAIEPPGVMAPSSSLRDRLSQRAMNLMATMQCVACINT